MPDVYQELGIPYYIVNKNAQTNGDHEVHETPQQHSNCTYPAVHNREEFGYHSTCHSAVTAAKALRYKANGCCWCARACHTG